MKRVKYYVCGFLAVIMIMCSGQSASAHLLSTWSQVYTKAKAGGDYHFAISNSTHMNGSQINYYWENSSARSYFPNAIAEGVKMWGGMINAIETSKSDAHLVVRYNPDSAAGALAHVARGGSGDSNKHFRKNAGDVEMMFYASLRNYSEYIKNRATAHELGHLWGILDLYDLPNKVFDSIYDDNNNGVTRHDKNAMYICLNNPWFQDASGNWKYQESAEKWVKNQWKTINGTQYYFKADGCRATSRTSISGEWHLFDSNGKYLGKDTGSTSSTASTGGSTTGRGTATIKYNANGGSSMPASHSVTKDSNGNANFNLSSIKPTRSGYTFLGWRLENNTAYGIDAPGKSISISGSATSNSTYTYYAQWSANNTTTVARGTATVKYNANGGSSVPASHSVTKASNGNSNFNLSSIKPTRSGYTFLGWRLENSTAYGIDAPGKSISISGSATSNSTYTYYAQWSR